MAFSRLAFSRLAFSTPRPATGRSLLAVVHAIPPPSGGSPGRLRLFVGHPGEQALEFRPQGWFLYLHGSEVLINRTTVDNRPRGTGSRRGYFWAVEATIYRGLRDVRCKVWPDDAPEPDFWDWMVWQDAHPDRVAAFGPVAVDAAGWTVAHLSSYDVADPVPPIGSAPRAPYDLTWDAGIHVDGRDVSLEIAQAVRRAYA